MAAGLDGMAEKRDLEPRCDNNTDTEARPPNTVETLPTSLLESLTQLAQNPMLPEAMEPAFTASLKPQHQTWSNHTNRPPAGNATD